MASPGLQQKSLSAVAGRASELLVGGIKNYFTSAAPTVSDISRGIKITTVSVSTQMREVINKTRQLNRQQGWQKLSTWFLGAKSEYDYSDPTSFDGISNESTEIITNEQQSADKISKTVVETSHQLVEAQLSATANILTSVDRLSSIMTSGFNTLNDTLGKLLEVTTNNSAALIQIVSTNNNEQSANDKMLSSGRFNFDDFKKIVSSNAQNSQYGTMVNVMKTMGSMYVGGGPEAIVDESVNAIMDRLFPRLRGNIKSFDDALNSALMSTLIRLGENRTAGGIQGLAGELFGLTAGNKQQTTTRAQLELGNVGFDTIARETLVNVIPGYLRGILKQQGGPDQVYDYRTRQFRTQSNMDREFRRALSETNTNSMRRANQSVRNALTRNDNINSEGFSDYSDFRDMVYDLLIEDMGNPSADGTSASARARNQFRTFDSTLAYLYQILPTESYNANRGRNLQTLAQSLVDLDRDPLARMDLHNQAMSSSVQRNNQRSNIIREFDNYNIDLSHITDDNTLRRDSILEYYGNQTASNSPSAPVSGLDYTNAVLFELYKRLNVGINVYNMNALRTRPFKPLSRLNAPERYRPPSETIDESSTRVNSGNFEYEGNNEQANNDNNDEIDQTRSQRFGNWARRGGRNLLGAMFRGTPADVQQVVGGLASDVLNVSGSYLRDTILPKINSSFGNITGYLKHKFMGTEYEYTNENGEKVKVDKDEKGGITGIISSSVSDLFKGNVAKANNWIQSVLKYFNFSNKGEKPDIASKRRALLSSSIGAMAGLGFLGGPMGILFGAIAGNALSTSNIGNKIKEFLFGKDNVDEDGNIKGRQLGFIEKAMNRVIDPIRFQIGKTLNTIGDQLKKNIFGPLSDIGAAIKERITNAASEASKSLFGRIFGGIGRGINNIKDWFSNTSIGKGLNNIRENITGGLFGLPISALGGLTRATTGAISGLAGGALGGLANIIGGSSGREVLRNRRQQREYELEASRARSGYYGDYDELDMVDDEGRVMLGPDGQPMKRFVKKKGSAYKAFKNREDARRRGIKLDSDTTTSAEDATAESTSEIAESTSAIEEILTEVSPRLSDLADAGLEEGSIYTHDVGIHDRLDKILEYITGNRSFANSLLNSSMTAASEGNLTNDDALSLGSMMDEVSKENPDTKILTQQATKIIKSNENVEESDISINREDKQNKSNGLDLSGMDSLLGLSGFSTSLLPYIAAGGLAASLLVPGINTFLWGEGSGENRKEGLLSNALTGLSKWLLGDENNQGAIFKASELLVGFAIESAPRIADALITGLITGVPRLIESIFNYITNSRRRQIESEMPDDINDFNNPYSDSYYNNPSMSGYGVFNQNSYDNTLNMKNSGCGPIVASYMANKYGSGINPLQSAQLLNNIGMRNKYGGTDINGIASVNQLNGIPMKTLIASKLSNGEPVAILGQSNNPNSPYTSAGHYIVGESIDGNGNVQVMDPLSDDKKSYNIDNITDGIRGINYVGYGLDIPSPFLNSQSYRVSSKYGMRNDPMNPNKQKMHAGLDMVADDNNIIVNRLGDNSDKDYLSTSNAELGAVSSGRVTRIDKNPKTSYGHRVTYIDDNGYQYTYGHLMPNSIPNNIQVGSQIKMGDLLGMMGSSGSSTGPHLHFEIKDPMGNTIDPSSVINKSSTNTRNVNSSYTSNNQSTNFNPSFSYDSSNVSDNSKRLASAFGILANATGSIISKATSYLGPFLGTIGGTISNIFNNFINPSYTTINTIDTSKSNYNPNISTPDISKIPKTTGRVTIQEMNQLGWSNITQGSINELNINLAKRNMSIFEMCHFLSQVSHESGCGKYRLEIASGEKYNNRKDLGNTQPGDGPKYKGAGYIQLTGRANYTDFSKYINDPEVINQGALYVAEKYPWVATFYFWDKYVHQLFVNNTPTVLTITKRINGGTNGLQDRQKYYDKAVKIFITDKNKIQIKTTPAQYENTQLQKTTPIDSDSDTGYGFNYAPIGDGNDIINQLSPFSTNSNRINSPTIRTNPVDYSFPYIANTNQDNNNIFMNTKSNNINRNIPSIQSLSSNDPNINPILNVLIQSLNALNSINNNTNNTNGILNDLLIKPNDATPTPRRINARSTKSDYNQSNISSVLGIIKPA